VLAGGKTSRLYEALVHRTGIAQDVSATQESLRHGSVFSIWATAKPGHTADEFEAAIQRELDALATDGPTDAELAAVTTRIRAATIFDLEHPAAVANRLGSPAPTKPLRMLVGSMTPSRRASSRSRAVVTFDRTSLFRSTTRSLLSRTVVSGSLGKRTASTSAGTRWPRRRDAS
jgi:hypothetical protein